MRLLGCFVLLSLYCTSLSLPSITPDQCCMPFTWEAVEVGFFHSGNNLFRQMKKHSADFKKSRYAMNVTSYVNTTVEHQLLLVFMSKDIAYLIDLDAKRCEKSSGQYIITRCLDSSWNYIGSGKMGGVLDVDSYVDSTGRSNIQVTHKDCLFVSESLIDTYADSYGGSEFYNLTSTIAHESVFDIPAYCNKSRVRDDITILPAFRKIRSFTGLLQTTRLPQRPLKEKKENSV